MKYILTALQIGKPYRGKWKWYDPIKGHTGVDLNFFNQPLPSPVSGKVMLLAGKGQSHPMQREMGNVIYLADKETGSIHVFAHMLSFAVTEGQHVERNQILGVTGNTGTASTGPHLHWEIISFQKPTKFLDRIMTRSLQGFVGWNIEPLSYLRNLYDKYGIDIKGFKK